MRPYRVVAALVLAGALASFAPTASAAVLVQVDKAAQQMSVIVDGELRWVWPVSTGLGDYDTPNGQYTAFRMEKEHYSTEWDDAPMPHSVFFTRIGHAIHGTTFTKRLGQPASHGCVRLAPQNAARLFALVRQHGLANTRVIVDGVIPPPPAPLIAKRVPLPLERGSRARPDEPPHEVGASAPVPRGRPQQHAARAYELPGDDETETHTLPDRPQRDERTYAAQPPAYAAPPPAYAARPPVARQAPVYVRPPSYERPRVYQRGRGHVPDVVYDPRVEVIVESYVNGTWVRRRYYRQARPQDYYWR